MYKWTCLNMSATGEMLPDSECHYLNESKVNIVTNEMKLYFPPRSFRGGSNMKWTLTVSKSFGHHTTYANVRIIYNTAVLVEIQTSKEGLKVNRNKLAILSAVAYSNTPYDLRYEWSSEPELPIESFANGIHEKYLKILPYTLDEDTRYTFTCAVTDSDGTTGYSVIRVTVNRAPRYGQFSVTPEKGISGATKFNFRATGWSDYDEPIKYAFSFFDKNTDMFLPIEPRSEKDSVATTLVGEGTIEIKLEIFDSLNASTIVYKTVSLTQSTIAPNLLLEKANDESKPHYERIVALTQSTQVMGCSTNASESCLQTVDILDSIEKKMTDHTPETDNAMLGILNSVNIQPSDKLEKTMEILNRIGTRENENIKNSASIYDEQFADKRIQNGLTPEATKLMAEIVGKTMKNMNGGQIIQQQKNIVNTVDVIARSLLKDSVPNEKPLLLKTEGYSITAQKISFCGNYTSNLTEGMMENVGFSIPICDILPINQTRFDNKTMNKQKPYDVIIQVFERNVVGKCAPLPTKLLRVVLYDDYEKAQYSVQNVLKGINFTFELNSSFPEDDLGKIGCVYYETGKEEFTPKTLTTTLLSIPEKKFHCSSNHLTEFTLNYVPNDLYKDFISIDFYIISGIFFFCIVMNVWAIYTENTDKGEAGKIINETIRKYRNRNPNNSPEKRKTDNNNDNSRATPEINISTFMPFDEFNNTSVKQNTVVYKNSTDESLRIDNSLKYIAQPEIKNYKRRFTIGIIGLIILVFFEYCL